jgi:hypothetical protein
LTAPEIDDRVVCTERTVVMLWRRRFAAPAIPPSWFRHANQARHPGDPSQLGRRLVPRDPRRLREHDDGSRASSVDEPALKRRPSAVARCSRQTTSRARFATAQLCGDPCVYASPNPEAGLSAAPGQCLSARAPVDGIAFCATWALYPGDLEDLLSYIAVIACYLFCALTLATSNPMPPVAHLSG